MFRWLVDNTSTFALALILAVFVWFVAVRETNPIIEQTFPEPVEIQMLNQPTGTVITNSPQEQLSIVVRGPKLEIDDLQADQFHAVVDLADVVLDGIYVPVVVTVDNPLVSIMEQDANRIFVRLEEYRQVSMPLSVTVSGAPALGHVSGNPIVQPDFVIVEGAASKVDPVKFARISLSVEGADSPVQDTLTVRLRDQNDLPVSGISPEPMEVSVTIPITKSDEYAELFVTLAITGTVAPGYRMVDYSIDPERIVVFGRPEVVSSLPGFISTNPVNIEEINTDLIRRVGLILPEGVSIIGDQSVVVEITVEPVLTTMTFPWTPTILGPDPGLTATISHNTVNVGVIGSLELMANFDPEQDLDLSVNLYGLEAGSHEVPLVALSKLSGVEIENILPESVQVELEQIPTATSTPVVTGTLTVTVPIPAQTGTPSFIPTTAVTPTTTLTPMPALTRTVTPNP